MTREHVKAMLPIMTAYAEGKEIQIKFSSGSNLTWHVCEDPGFTDSPSYYRIKPEPKLRAWKINEVPIGALIRQKLFPSNVTIIAGTWKGCVKLGIYQAGDLNLGDCEYSTDGGKNWSACGVLAD
jgi:hypothetical protein